MNRMTRRQFAALVTSGTAAAVLGRARGAAPTASSRAWSFGIISDTQWSPPEGHAGLGVATEIIDNMNAQFLRHGVRFVVAVGDVTDRGSKVPEELDIRAAHTAALREAGIGFFPLRGNHEGSLIASRRWPHAFPGLPGTEGFAPADGIVSEGSPTLPGLAGHSYAFANEDASFVLLDQFIVDDGSELGTAHPIARQQPWITERLEGASRDGRHAFVFAHKNLLGQNHKDNLFGDHDDDPADPGDGSPEARAAATAFVGAMDANGSRYFFCGHDHIYHRALVRAPEAPSHAVQQVITGSNSYKFYTPEPPYSPNELPIAQQRRALGYTVVTVDGPLVQVDYYAVVVPGDGPLTGWTPERTWPLMDRFGYGRNGLALTLREGDSLTGIRDRFAGTTARILEGACEPAQIIHEEAATNDRRCAYQVTTGWSPRPAGALSDSLRLWGLRVGLSSPRTSQYALAVSTTGAFGRSDGRPTLLTRDESGSLVPAVALNTGGTPRCVAGRHRGGYPLGTYGFDEDRGEAWAVVNHDGEFVVGRG